jgi:hypothetical protein
MPIFKFSFLKNEILSCREAEDNTQFDGSYYLEHDKGQLIFAIVRADSENTARLMVEEIVEKVQAG